MSIFRRIVAWFKARVSSPDWPYRDDCVLTNEPEWLIDGTLANPGQRPFLKPLVRTRLLNLGLRTVGDVRRTPDDVLLRHLDKRSLAELRSITTAPADVDSDEHTAYLRRLNAAAMRAEDAEARARNPDLIELGISLGAYPANTISVGGRPVIPGTWRDQP